MATASSTRGSATTTGTGTTIDTTTTELKLIKTLWGIDEPISVELFQSIQHEGYHGIECIRVGAWSSKKEQDRLVHALNTTGLAVVCQLHTAGGYLEDAKYVYCGAYDRKVHEQNFTTQLHDCIALIRRVETPGSFINVHAGVDAWPHTDMIDFLTYCFQDIATYCCSKATSTGRKPTTSTTTGTAVDTNKDEDEEEDIEDEQEDDNSIMVTFETHRQRIFCNPFQTQQLLSVPAIRQSKYMKFNADLSHWYVACERVFDAHSTFDQRDRIWWPQLLAELSQRCEYIHARFGFAQGPQLADPSAVECQPERSLQIQVWKELLQEQLKRKKQKPSTTTTSTSSTTMLFVSPEYGPAPYLPSRPHTQVPVASLSDAVAYTKQILEELFDSLVE